MLSLSDSRFRWGVAGGLVVLLLVGLGMFKAKEPPAPVSLAPFVQTLNFVTLEDGQPVGNVVEQPAGSGFYVDIRLKLATDLPESYEQEEVSPPEKWPMVIRFYPDDQGAQSDKAFNVKCIPYHRSKLKQLSKSISLPVGSIPAGTIRAFQPKAGFDGPPPIPPPWPEDERWYWTFFALPHDTPPGDFTYEILVYPTAKWTSSVRFTLGPEVVLHRGTTRLVPTTAAG